MPTPYPFQSGATLTAAQMNSLSELPIRSITSSATALATDAYSRVIANGSAITYTLPNSTFGTAQVIEFHNINSTVATIAAGAGVTLNGADVLTVSQWQGGEIFFSSPSTAIFFPTRKKSGLELISSTTASGVASVNITGCFSSTYDNYLILCKHTGTAGGSGYCTFQYLVGTTATTANYIDRTAQFYAAALGWELYDNGAGTDENIASVFSGNAAPQSELTGFALTIFGPNRAKPTSHNTNGLATFTVNRYHQTSSGGQTDNTAFDGIKFIFPGASHSAQIEVYGYSK